MRTAVASAIAAPVRSLRRARRAVRSPAVPPPRLGPARAMSSASETPLDKSTPDEVWRRILTPKQVRRGGSRASRREETDAWTHLAAGGEADEGFGAAASGKDAARRGGRVDASRVRRPSHPPPRPIDRPPPARSTRSCVSAARTRRSRASTRTSRRRASTAARRAVPLCTGARPSSVRAAAGHLFIKSSRAPWTATKTARTACCAWRSRAHAADRTSGTSSRARALPRPPTRGTASILPRSSSPPSCNRPHRPAAERTRVDAHARVGAQGRTIPPRPSASRSTSPSCPLSTLQPPLPTPLHPAPTRPRRADAKSPIRPRRGSPVFPQRPLLVAHEKKEQTPALRARASIATRTRRAAPFLPPFPLPRRAEGPAARAPCPPPLNSPARRLLTFRAPQTRAGPIPTRGEARERFGRPHPIPRRPPARPPPHESQGPLGRGSSRPPADPRRRESRRRLVDRPPAFDVRDAGELERLQLAHRRSACGDADEGADAEPTDAAGGEGREGAGGECGGTETPRSAARGEPGHSADHSAGKAST